MYSFSSCTFSDIQGEQYLLKNKIQEKGDIGKEQQTIYTKIGNSIGLIVLNDNYSEKDTVKIYNEDSSLWYKFTYFYDDRDGKFDYSNDEFQPFAFHPDYFVLGLEVYKEDKSEYQIIVNKEKGLKKRIRKESFLQFLTWEQYVLKAFAVGFNFEEIFIYEKSGTESKTIRCKSDNTFHPVKIQGEWLQIKWGEKNNWSYGWIKWKEKNKLLIYVYLFA